MHYVLYQHKKVVFKCCVELQNKRGLISHS